VCFLIVKLKICPFDAKLCSKPDEVCVYYCDECDDLHSDCSRFKSLVRGMDIRP